jgi:opacity protein-like surface antigen
MTHRTLRRPIAALFALTVIAFAAESSAEWYVGGYGGITLPNKLSNIHGTGVDADKTTSDLKLQNSFLYGAKIGRFFENIPWLGLEADLSYARPNLKQQTVTSNFLGIPVSRLSPGADVDVAMGLVNIIARYPGQRFQPYIGGGAGLAYGRISHLVTASSTNASATDTSIAFDFLTGMRVFVTKHVALFTEYKYTRTSFSWENNVLLKGDYSAHNLAVGLSFHFN